MSKSAIKDSIQSDQIKYLKEGNKEDSSTLRFALSFINKEEKDNLKILLNHDEVADVRWICFDRLKEEISLSPTNFTPWLRIYVQDHFDQIIN